MAYRPEMEPQDVVQVVYPNRGHKVYLHGCNLSKSKNPEYPGPQHTLSGMYFPHLVPAAREKASKSHKLF